MNPGDKIQRWSRNYIANVFYDEAVEKIWFNLGDIRIDGKKLGAVGKLITDDKIQCFSNVPDSILKGREAAYQFDKDFLLLSVRIKVNDLGVIEKSAILHEGVHAYLDYKKAAQTTIFHNEALAYVAQALFLHNKKTAWPSHLKNDPIIKAVEELIRRFKMDGNRAWLQWVHFESLMRVIQAHPVYRPRGYIMPWDKTIEAKGVAMQGAPDGSTSKGTQAMCRRGPMGQQTRNPAGVVPRRGPTGFA